MNIKIVLCLVLSILVSLTSTVCAMDVGVLAPTEQKFRAEVYYEDYEREIQQERSFSNDIYSGLQEEQRVVARVTFSPQRFWGLSLEAGATDADESEDVSPMFGAGAHIVLLERGDFYTSAFGRITWSTGIEYQEDYSVVRGTEWVEDHWVRDEEYIEYGMGVQIGYAWQPCAHARVTGYAGAMASFLDDTKSEERESATYKLDHMTEPESLSAKDSSVDMEESHVAQMFAGIEVALLPWDAGLRVEGRFYDYTSLSASLFWNF